MHSIRYMDRGYKNVSYVAAGLGVALAARAIVRRWTALDLKDKVVLVTGGSRGLGLVLSRQLVAHGAKLAICARDPDELMRATADLVERGGDVLPIPCDLTDREQAVDLVNRVRDRFGRIDVLINNAGMIQVGPMELMTLEDYEHAMAIHFWGPLHLMLEVIPEMRERGEGRIVNITSIGGKLPVPHLLPYTASKFALVGLSEGMRVELAQRGVHVTTVVPGLMRTGSPINALFKGRHHAEYTWFAIADSLPVTSMRAERAARKIITAMRVGDPEVVLSLQAKVATKLNALAPRVIQRLLSLVNRILPAPGGIGTETAKGRDSGTRATRSILTRAGDRATERNNQLT